MKFIFRGHIVFEYIPGKKKDCVVQGRVSDVIPAFDFCSMIPEDYQLLSVFFDRVYRHIEGEEVVLDDIIVD